MGRCSPNPDEARQKQVQAEAGQGRGGGLVDHLKDLKKTHKVIGHHKSKKKALSRKFTSRPNFAGRKLVIELNYNRILSLLFKLHVFCVHGPYAYQMTVTYRIYVSLVNTSISQRSWSTWLTS